MSSGTRKTFVTTFLGFSSNTITGAGSVGGTMGSCVKETNAANTPIEENDGRFLVNSKNLIPYSVGVWMAQASGVTDDIRGRASLGSVDLTNATVQGKMPMSINSNGVYDRLLYNVVPVEATTGSGTTAHGFNATGTQELFVGAVLGCRPEGRQRLRLRLRAGRRHLGFCVRLWLRHQDQLICPDPLTLARPRPARAGTSSGQHHTRWESL